MCSSKEGNIVAHLRKCDDKETQKDVLASQLYVLPHKAPFNRCYKFAPKNVDAFDNGKEYGLHIGDQMVKYFIIFMADSFEALQQIKASSHKRVRMPNRKSIGPVASPFVDYKVLSRDKPGMVIEKSQAQKDKKSGIQKARQLVKNAQDAVILSQFKKRGEAGPGSNPTVEASSAETNVISSPKFNSVQGSENVTIPTPNGDVGTENGATSKDVLPVDNFPCEKCSPEVAKLEAQLDLALSSADAMSLKYDEIKKERDLLKRQLDRQFDKINEINDKITKLPDRMRSMQKSNCWLLNLTSNKIVTVGKKYKDVIVPEGSYYIGKGKVLNGNDLGPCADPDTMRKRVESLCDAFFGDEVPFMSPSGQRGKYGTFLPKIIPIEDCHYSAMQVILKAMPWDDIIEKETKKNTLHMLKEGVRKYTMAKCLEYVKENFPEEYQKIEDENKSNRVLKSKKRKPAAKNLEEESDDEVSNEYKKNRNKKGKKAEDKEDSEDGKEENTKRKRFGEKRDVDSSTEESSSEGEGKNPQKKTKGDKKSYDSDESIDEDVGINDSFTIEMQDEGTTQCA